MNHMKQATGGPGQPTETALFVQAQVRRACRDSLNRLMATHENLVHTVVRRQALGCLPFSEALQAGRTGLWRAIVGYDSQRGLAFSTYAWKVTMHRIWRRGPATCGIRPQVTPARMRLATPRYRFTAMMDKRAIVRSGG